MSTSTWRCISNVTSNTHAQKKRKPFGKGMKTIVNDENVAFANPRNGAHGQGVCLMLMMMQTVNATAVAVAADGYDKHNRIDAALRGMCEYNSGIV